MAFRELTPEERTPLQKEEYAEALANLHYLKEHDLIDRTDFYWYEKFFSPTKPLETGGELRVKMMQFRKSVEFHKRNLARRQEEEEAKLKESEEKAEREKKKQRDLESKKRRMELIEAQQRSEQRSLKTPL